jgi:hypothetical protein
LHVFIPNIERKGQKLNTAVKIGNKPINPKYFKFPSTKNKILNSINPIINLKTLPKFFIKDTPFLKSCAAYIKQVDFSHKTKLSEID